ncbi:hypothetical protein IEI94_08795 [Halomonas sp. ML-15]|uniref:LPO_1073/Vpar_1526 family protein n=1 Tax=Halomonas sp. ML-15 TaxID=2773305 RepID=UPI0017460579|nr:LPO_1073/Vpar_1526 family protein [Halomonas sp. ML-15]MBD3895945.1 hypothetical protein [Halomonas sp. ML-15]
MTRQSQKGGEGSNNFQAQEMVVQVGIDEKRAREVFQEMNLQLRKEYTQEALEVANARVSEFENSLMPKMERVEGALEAFADPSFQLLLVEAQKTAAATERPADYDLLSELLIHRFQKGSNRNARAGVSLAIDIVDKVSDEALLGLTVAHAVAQFGPISGGFQKGLNALEGLFGKLLYGELPKGQEWLDHLDVLNAIRLNSFGSMKKIREFYSNELSGYLDVGIEKKSENHEIAIEILSKNNLPKDLLVEHDFNNQYLRIPVANRERIRSLALNRVVMHEGKQRLMSLPLTKDQLSAVDSIYDLYAQDNSLRKGNVDSLMVEWDNHPNLKALRQWWDNIPVALTITSVGKVLAHSNAQRRDKTLPPLN